MRKSRAAFAASVVWLASCGSAQTPTTTAPPPGIDLPVQPPIALALDDADAHPVDLATFRGRALLVVAFTMDDLNSQAILRNVEQLARAHPDDLVTIAISGDRQPYAQHRTLVQSFAQVLGLARTRILLADDDVRDGASPLGLIEAVPTTLLVNRAGVLSHRVVGYLTLGQLEALVAPALPNRPR